MAIQNKIWVVMAIYLMFLGYWAVVFTLALVKLM